MHTSIPISMFHFTERLSLWPTEYCLTCNTWLHSVFVLLSKHTAIVLLSKHRATIRFNNSTQILDDYLTWDLTACGCGARKEKLYIVIFYVCMTQYPLLKIRDCIPGRSETTQEDGKITGIFLTANFGIRKDTIEVKR